MVRGDSLGTTASMSRSLATELLKDLAATGWVEKAAATWVRTAGPRPFSYRPPRLIVEPRIPRHCGKLASRIANLHRGPSADKGHRREGARAVEASGHVT